MAEDRRIEQGARQETETVHRATLLMTISP